MSLKDTQPFISKWHLKKVLPYVNLANSIVSATVYAYYTYWPGSSISYRMNGGNRKKFLWFFKPVSITSSIEHHVNMCALSEENHPQIYIIGNVIIFLIM